MTETQNARGSRLMEHRTEEPELIILRRMLLFILIVELLGILAELLLTDHTEDFWQLLPIVLMIAALLTLGWAALDRRAAPLRFLQALMLLFVLSGFYGSYLHYRAKVEFQLEVNPSLAGSALFWEAMRSQSPPPLAAGVMIQMGLLGFAYAYRHPALRKNSATKNPESR